MINLCPLFFSAVFNRACIILNVNFRKSKLMLISLFKDALFLCGKVECKTCTSLGLGGNRRKRSEHSDGLF